MLCSGRILAGHLPQPTALIPQNSQISNSRFLRGNLKSNLKWRLLAIEPDASSSSFSSPLPSTPVDADSTDKNATGFCIIEGPEMEDFTKMQLQEIQDNIRSRRNKIFLHMEEVRRLRIQQRIKNAEQGILNEEHEDELPNFPSFIPFLPPLTSANLKQYYATCFSLIGGIMIFGGLLAPTLELKLGLGGTSYEDFIRNMHLPLQLRCSAVVALP